MRLGVIETKFAEIIWANAPIGTSELIKLAAEELGWKRTTTYTVLSRLSARGLFRNNGGTVEVLITKEDFNTMQSSEIVNESFGGSLPAFIAAFARGKELSESEISEIRSMIDSYKKQ